MSLSALAENPEFFKGKTPGFRPMRTGSLSCLCIRSFHLPIEHFERQNVIKNHARATTVKEATRNAAVTKACHTSSKKLISVNSAAQLEIMKQLDIDDDDISLYGHKNI